MADTAMCRGNDWQAINRSRPETCAVKLSIVSTAQRLFGSPHSSGASLRMSRRIRFPMCTCAHSVFHGVETQRQPWLEGQEANPE
jgi:hypothetical protein